MKRKKGLFTYLLCLFVVHNVCQGKIQGRINACVDSLNKMFTETINILFELIYLRGTQRHFPPKCIKNTF